MTSNSIRSKHRAGERLCGILFLILVSLFCALGGVRLIRYYIYDPVLNEAFTADAGDERESALIANLPGKDVFIDANGMMRRILGQREMNGVIRLTNEYLTDIHGAIPEETLKEEAEAVAHVQQVLSEYEIPFLYVATPIKVASQGMTSDAEEATETETERRVGAEHSELPTGVVDEGNANLDRFLMCLAEDGVRVLDLRECIKEDGIDPYSLFYRTDHHWTTEGGFYAARKLIAWVQDVTGAAVPSDVTDPNAYDYTVYPQWHLGSNARRTGKLYAGVDDFTMITPTFMTDLTNRVSGERGSYEEVVLDMSSLSERDLTASAYDRLFVHALEQMHNEKAENEVRVLLICDSFGAAVNPYLALAFSDTECMSAYAPGLLTRSYLEQNRPDVVILMQYSGLNLGIPSSFEFGL